MVYKAQLNEGKGRPDNAGQTTYSKSLLVNYCFQILNNYRW